MRMYAVKLNASVIQLHFASDGGNQHGSHECVWVDPGEEGANSTDTHTLRHETYLLLHRG